LEINESTILKVGYTVQMGEAEAMCLVRKTTSVPVPQVLNAYMIGDIGFILMEKIPGEPLDKCWAHLSRDSMESITKQLHYYVQQWRKIEGTFLGSVDGGPCEDVIFKHPWEAKTYRYGPFQTRRGFNQGVVEALRKSRPNGKLSEKDYVLVERILASGNHGQDERKVFTHGDLHQSNIIIENNVIAGIVDWGAAGYSIAAREYFGLKWSALDLVWRDLSSTVLQADEYEFWAGVNYSMMEYTGF
jgi:aminoglycoside phosphotransferase (APT) family kinase protein